jgi:uncharacterized protein YbjT (DUF2867 family)
MLLQSRCFSREIGTKYENSVLGATGGTGRLIVRDALSKGNSVVALVRSKATAPDLPGAKVVEGDARDEAAIVRALDGCDAVVSSLGTGMGLFGEVTLLSIATPALIAAMTQAGVRRLVCISALGVGDSRGHGGFLFDRVFQPLLLRNAYKDKERQEAAIRASSLDWVIVRPGELNDEPARGTIRAFTDVAGIHGGKIARADVARFAVDQLIADTWLRRTPLILW